MRPDCSTPVAPTEDGLSATEPTERAANRQGTGRRDRRVCVVEDDASVCDSLVVLLEIYGFETVAYASGAALLADQRHREMGCLIIDQHLPEMDGIEVLTALQRKAIFVPTILVSGRLDAATAVRAGKLGAIAVLEKPLAVTQLVDLVRGGLEPPR